MESPRSDDLRHLWWLAPAGAGGALLYLLEPILTPFLLAAMLALPASAALLVWLRHARQQIPGGQHLQRALMPAVR